MKKLTATSLALAITLSCGATSVLASSFEDKDMAFAFESEGRMEVATLSDQEMKETEGAVFGLFVRLWSWMRPVAAEVPRNAGIGAAAGGVQYGVTNGGTSNWSTQGQFQAIGSGAVGGAAGGLIPKYPTAGAIVGGAAGGGVDRFFGSSSPSTNNSSNFGLDVGSYCANCYTGNGTYGWPR